MYSFDFTDNHQVFLIVSANFTGFPGIIAAFRNIQYFGHLHDMEHIFILKHEYKFCYRCSFAKKAVAFFKIAFSSLNSAFSFSSFRSLSSSDLALPPASKACSPYLRYSAYQFLMVELSIPSSRPRAVYDLASGTRLTTVSLKSGVYIFIPPFCFQGYYIMSLLCVYKTGDASMKSSSKSRSIWHPKINFKSCNGAHKIS